MNYNVFDPFLTRDTWHTSHPIDDRVFFLCLHKIVRSPEFSPEAMGDYMRTAKGVDTHEHHYAERIRNLVRKAWDVREYLQAVGD